MSAHSSGVVAAWARSERVVTGAGLLLLTLLAWLYLVLLADSMDAMAGGGGSAAFMALMPMGRWGPAELALCFAMWLVMMIAMMVPSAAPMLFAFNALSRSRPGRERAGQWSVAFLMGYMLVWSAFSVLATGVQWGLREAALVTDLMASASPRLNAVNLLWIAVLAAVVLAEKLLPFGAMTARVAGMALMAGGLWILALSGG